MKANASLLASARFIALFSNKWRFQSSPATTNIPFQVFIDPYLNGSSIHCFLSLVRSGSGLKSIFKLDIILANNLYNSSYLFLSPSNLLYNLQLLLAFTCIIATCSPNFWAKALSVTSARIISFASSVLSDARPHSNTLNEREGGSALALFFMARLAGHFCLIVFSSL